LPEERWTTARSGRVSIFSEGRRERGREGGREGGREDQ
jgi:hypothetical protein